LHYNWHWHYDPTLGRYTRANPLRFVDGPIVYGYAKGSPLRFVDPRGPSNDDNIVPWPKNPLPAMAGPNSPLDKWAKDKLKKCWNWLTDKIGGEEPDYDDNGCAKAQKYWQDVIDQYLELYAKSNEFDRYFLDREQKPDINRRIARHNQRCPNHQVKGL
jgi:hypothetical protein